MKLINHDPSNLKWNAKLVPWDVCTMPKDEGNLGLIDVATHGNILGVKWVVRWLEGLSPWQEEVLLVQNTLICSFI
jgi:hypothetical protein